MGKPRYLTKSRFTLALQCPTKLYYNEHPEYGNKKLDDQFLKALAEGGFQVGALAKIYHPGGVDLSDRHGEKAEEETRELLRRDEVTIFEAAIRHGDLMVRVDVLKKKGNHFELIEVKSKSFDPREENPFFGKREYKQGYIKINADYQKYLMDVAFQAYVLKKAYPDHGVSPFLCMVNKAAVATVEGLNQKFFLKRENDRPVVVLHQGLTRDGVGDEILCTVNVSEAVDAIHEGRDQGKKTRKELGMASFEEEIALYAQAHREDRKIPPAVGSGCKNCEFRIGEDLLGKGLKSGFAECWREAAGLGEEDLKRPLVFDLWSFQAKKYLDARRYFMAELQESELSLKPRDDGKQGLSASERRWLQVKHAKGKLKDAYEDGEGLAAEMASWKYPLHFIDFETTRVAIPFNQGRRPYEQIAFQFSHHVVHEDGTIEHAGQWINRERGKFPNYEFVRQLKAQLDGDEGTIFRYADHENNVLKDIHDQMMREEEGVVPDRDALCAFIRSITQAKETDTRAGWEGPRNMVDMLELVKRFYWHPDMAGSNSIKKVLPAVLRGSKFLQEKYVMPIYGDGHSITSLNFKNQVWIERDERGQIKDPYKQLEPIFSGVDEETLDEYLCRGAIDEGGAAMMAYAKMQFTQMTAEEEEQVVASLLRYCELDTFAMVMIYEHWRHLTQSAVPARSKRQGSVRG